MPSSALSSVSGKRYRKDSGRSEAILSPRLDMTLGNDIASVSTVLDKLEAFAEENGIAPQQIMRLNLILDELITNTVSYGFPKGGAGTIHLSVELVDGTVNVELKDNGVAFNPIEAVLPERSGDVDQREIGGLGLKLVRNYAKRLDYRRDGAFNHLHLEMDVG
jgi:serine/threonine-protein kinase RsbW